MSTNNTYQSSRWIVIQALIVFGWAMLTHSLLLLVIDVSLPSKLPQILMALSATLIYDSALLIDLARGSIPMAYSPLDVLSLGMAPWLIAGMFSVQPFKNTTDALRGAIMGVILSAFVFIYTWVGIGGFSLIGLLLSIQFFVGSVVNMVVASVGAICRLRLDPWVQRIINKMK
ncbi:MAG: hypothetical protein ACE5R6_08355 [Candidatus Heimdallarchaeota archaeon]